MNERKLQLKYEHRDRLVKIGIQAIEHALRFEPSEQARKTIEQRLTALRTNDLPGIKRVIREPRSTIYSKDSVLILATIELSQLAVTERYPSDIMIRIVLLRCNDAATFLSDYRTAQYEKQVESDWQNKNLEPLIGQSFQELFSREKALRREERRAKLAVVAECTYPPR